MHRGRSRADHHLRKAARDLLSEPAIRLLLPGPDQPAPAGEHFAAGKNCRARESLTADYTRGRHNLTLRLIAPHTRSQRSAGLARQQIPVWINWKPPSAP